MLTDRLLGDVEDEVSASIEKDILRLTAKKNQLEHTLSMLRNTLIKHRKKVDAAQAQKTQLGQIDLRYRKEHFYLYHSIFNFKLMKPGETYPGFFDASEEAETESYKIDFNELDAAIESHHANAEKLALLTVPDAAALVRQSIVASIVRANRLEDFKNTIQKEQIKINQAIECYAETLERLEKLTDDVDHNEDMLKQVLTDIENLKLMQARCESLEKTYNDFRP